MRTQPDNRYTDSHIKARLELFYGKERDLPDGQIPYWQDKLDSYFSGIKS